MTILETIFAPQFGEHAIDEMCARGDLLIEAIPLERPIRCTLFDSQGGQLARFTLGSEDPTERECGEIEAALRSQAGASLRMVDANGHMAEVLLIVCAEIVQ